MPLVPRSAGPEGGDGGLCCPGRITSPAWLSSHLESARKTRRRGKVLPRRLLSREQQAGHSQHEPRAASHQDFLKSGACCDFLNFISRSKMLLWPWSIFQDGPLRFLHYSTPSHSPRLVSSCGCRLACSSHPCLCGNCGPHRTPTLVKRSVSWKGGTRTRTPTLAQHPLHLQC